MLELFQRPAAVAVTAGGVAVFAAVIGIGAIVSGGVEGGQERHDYH